MTAGSNRGDKSSYSDANTSRDYSQDMVHEAFQGSLYKEYRNSTVVSSGIENFLVNKISTGSTNINVISENLEQIADTNSRQNRAASSFDLVYCPYSTNFNGSGLSNFEVPTNKTAPNSLKLNPFNPNNSLSLYYAPTGSQLYQNSLVTSGSPTSYESSLLNNPTGWLESGHNISWSTHGTAQYYNLGFDNNYTESTGQSVEVTNIRAVGLRAPMVLTGWGFDTNAKPVPADTDNPDIFAPGAFSDPSLWKSGPVDFRWDNTKKVWVTGGGQGVMKFQITDTNDVIAENATACDHVFATVIEIGCGTESVSVGDTGILVFDDDLCFFNIPYSILIGLRGTAQEMVNPYKDNNTGTDCIPEAKALGACRWVVTGLCCGEEILVP